MRRTIFFGAVLTCGLVSAGAASAGADHPQSNRSAQKPKVTIVQVTQKEYKFILSRKTVPVGKVTFVITNKGTIPHNMVFQGPILYASSPLIAAGGKYRLTVRFKKPGAYTYVCTPHFELGMSGRIRVVKA